MNHPTNGGTELKEKRKLWDRRDEDRRIGERRGQADPRVAERRRAERREDFCPSCGGALTPESYCAVCKARLIRIRPFPEKRTVGL
jgi:hypothetical protein